MSGILQPRRFESSPFICKDNPNDLARNKAKECIWERDDLIQKLKEHLLSSSNENYHYYQFCNKCIGSEQDLTGHAGPTGK